MDARLYYLQGTIKRIGKNQDGTISMTLLAEKTFDNPASGAQIPFEIGKEYSFLLKELPSKDLLNQKVIIYGGGITSNDRDRFLGAKIAYFLKNKHFVDFNGNEAVLPPTDYPYEL
ncbi:hypothetical protein [Bacillus sp. B-jedd]|uniref:hypothetical protein n=1 Tax=Bacillus sp. B-jedd TaxID=1476857 RepID=UPI0005156075|nr:hypothetical protein [Bacillus sp. B-jedd]CEG27147.1 hypothetical protein BN1002_02003 [Bacillus sp. B-jedd]